MSLKSDLTVIRRSKLLSNILLHQKVRPEYPYYGSNLKAILDGVLCTSERRKLIRQWFLQLAPNSGYMRLNVNRKRQFQTNDPDLKYLLSVGFIKLCRHNYGKGKRSGCFNSYLTLNKEDL